MRSVYAEPAQLLELGEERASSLLPWLDEIVSLSLGGLDPRRFYRVQALFFAVIDVVAPFMDVSVRRQAASQRRTVNPGAPQVRTFGPLREEVRSAADLLRTEHARRWTLPDLARSVHLSPSQLGRIFVDAYGKTPMAFLAMIRVEKMAALLRATCEPIGVIAGQVGWRDADHASRQFRRRTGLTPRQYRAVTHAPAHAGGPA